MLAEELTELLVKHISVNIMEFRERLKCLVEDLILHPAVAGIHPAGVLSDQELR